MRALILGLAAAILGGHVDAPPTDPALQGWLAKPDVDLSKIGVTYWRVDEPWADRDAVVTMDDEVVEYSTRCDVVHFYYTEDWDFGESFEVTSVREDRFCWRPRAVSLLRFYFLLRESDLVKPSEYGLDIGQSLVTPPSIRLRPFVPTGLEFRRWIIAEYLDGARLSAPDVHYLSREHPEGPPVPMPAPVVTFDRGELEGSPGCGALMGGYTRKGQSLKIHAGFLLLGWCPENLLSQNDRVLAALRRATRAVPDGANMVLRGEKGEVEVELAPA